VFEHVIFLVKSVLPLQLQDANAYESEAVPELNDRKSSHCQTEVGPGV